MEDGEKGNGEWKSDNGRKKRREGEGDGEGGERGESGTGERKKRVEGETDGRRVSDAYKVMRACLPTNNANTSSCVFVSPDTHKMAAPYTLLSVLGIWVGEEREGKKHQKI